jgi:hypothetical protein
MADAPPSPTELIELLVIMLEGVAGGSKDRWREVLGPVEKLNIVFNPRSDWRLDPKGTEGELEITSRAIDIARHAHPYLSWRRTP